MQTNKFPLKKLRELVNFVPENSRSDLMPEVLRAAASKFTSSGRENPTKFMWTVPGCQGAPQTMDLRPNNLEKLQIVAKTVGTRFNILKVESFCFSSRHREMQMIADHVDKQGELLQDFEGGQIVVKEDFFLLQRISMRWKVERVRVNMGEWVSRLKLNDMAGSSLDDNGHINILAIHMRGRVQVTLNALKRVWEIADQMHIFNQNVLDLEVGGGRGEDREAAWQLVLNFLHGNNNVIDVIE